MREGMGSTGSTTFDCQSIKYVELCRDNKFIVFCSGYNACLFFEIVKRDLYSVQSVTLSKHVAHYGVHGQTFHIIT